MNIPYLNKTELIGRVRGAPEMRTAENGRPYVVLTLVTAERRADPLSSGHLDRHDWHRLVFVDTLAHQAAGLIADGTCIYTRGKLRTRAWSHDGDRRYLPEIRVDAFEVLAPQAHTFARPPMQQTASDRSDARRS